MRKTADIMSMPVIVEVIDKNVKEDDFNEIFSFLHYIDKKFSTFRKDSEISQINRGEIKEVDFSNDMKKVLLLCEKTKKDTNGYFDIYRNGIIDPTGIVKGYAINEAALILLKKGYKNLYVEIAGDIQVYGKNRKGEDWKIGIQNPFKLNEIIKVISLSNKGIATSGEYIKKGHIYNPKNNFAKNPIASVSVIGRDVLEADRFATALYAMGEKAFDFITKVKGIECYIVNKDKRAIYTPGLSRYTN